MDNPINKQIDYLRRCYRSDNNDLTLTNVSRLGARIYWLEDRDSLLSGEFSRIPLVGTPPELLFDLMNKYPKERRLVYGAFFLEGEMASSFGQNQTRKLLAPLFYCSAQIEKSELIYASLDSRDISINRACIRELLKPDVDVQVIDSFPSISGHLDHNTLAKVSDWLGTYTRVKNLESVGLWPKLTSHKDSRSKELVVLHCACALILADRPRGSRGVLHELNQLTQCHSFSPALAHLFRPNETQSVNTRSSSFSLKRRLSKAQWQALENAARHSLSVVTGPPGTGKSHTIAATAVHRVLMGGSVLVVARTAQAVRVVASKLGEDFGVEEGIVHCYETDYLSKLKRELDILLKRGGQADNDGGEIANKLKKVERQLSRLERRIRRGLWAMQLCAHKGGYLKRFCSRLVRHQYPPQKVWQDLAFSFELEKRYILLSRDYLREDRQRSISQLISHSRSALMNFLKGLRARNSQDQLNRFSNTNFSKVIEAMPIWLVTVDQLSQVLPFEKELFDLLIVDEATQSDVASVLPALQRSRSAMIVGDGEQLRHVSFLSYALQARLLRQCGLEESEVAVCNYRDESLYDVAANTIQNQSAMCFLDEHFRSYPQLIAFSNATFYGNNLKLMRLPAKPGVSSPLTFRRVFGSGRASGVNRDEANILLEDLAVRIDTFLTQGTNPSIGVLSPFREQAEFIQTRLEKQFSQSVRDQFQLRAATPYGFQGEERDIMFISVCVDEHSLRAATYLNRSDVFNVAVTRAKNEQVVYYSLDLSLLKPSNFLRSYVEFNSEPVISIGSDEYCEFAEYVKNTLIAEGISVSIGVSVGGSVVDLLCERDSTRIGLDLVGYGGIYHHGLTLYEIRTLYRAGVRVIPVSLDVWKNDKARVIHYLVECIKEKKSSR